MDLIDDAGQLVESVDFDQAPELAVQRVRRLLAGSPNDRAPALSRR